MTQANPFDLLVAEHELLREHLGRARTALRARGNPGNRAPEAEALAEALRIHFRREETALYPLCERLFGGPESAVRVLQEDHRAIGEALGLLRDARRNPREGLRRLENLGRLLESHLAREEKVLFPLAESRMSVAQANLLTRGLRNARTH